MGYDKELAFYFVKFLAVIDRNLSSCFLYEVDDGKAQVNFSKVCFLSGHQPLSSTFECKPFSNFYAGLVGIMMVNF